MIEEHDFAALYREHYARVRALCRHLLGDATLADDAAQAAFLRAHEAHRTYDSAQPFEAWIMRIATNHCLDRIRRRARERDLFGDEDVERAAATAGEADLLGTVLSAERARGINAAIGRLPEKYRVPLVLAYFRDASYDEIATTLGLTRTHVGVLICRAKQALRRELAAEEPQ